jgi:hypothetical protein
VISLKGSTGVCVEEGSSRRCKCKCQRTSSEKGYLPILKKSSRRRNRRSGFAEENNEFPSAIRSWCNVPTLGHHHRAEIYDDQNSQMGARESTWVFERHCGVHLALMIIFHHYEPFRIGWLWFRCILTISMILTILSYKSMEFTEEVILGTLLGGTSQCNSSLELGGETL